MTTQAYALVAKHTNTVTLSIALNAIAFGCQYELGRTRWVLSDASVVDISLGYISAYNR